LLISLWGSSPEEEPRTSGNFGEKKGKQSSGRGKKNRTKKPSHDG